jgi:hypothetical protein
MNRVDGCVSKAAVGSRHADVLHACAGEASYRHHHATARRHGPRRDLKLVLEFDVDVHEDIERDVLQMSGLLTRSGNGMGPDVDPRAPSQRDDPMRRRPSC